jgi:hypothetical protein
MRRKACFAFAAALLASLLMPKAAAAKDFPESVLATDPLAAAARPGVPAGMNGAFEYGNYALAHDDVDSFYFRLSGSPVIFAIGDSFALGGDFESILMCGPVSAGDTPANIAAFWMNAVQFQYGVYASLALPLQGRPRLLAEYARTSQHDLRAQYSQVSYDLLIGGVAAPELALGPVSLRSSLRAGYGSLFAFWHSSLAQPRMSWMLLPSAEAEFPLGLCSLVARVYPELFIDRYSSSLDADWFAEAGAAFVEGGDSTELLLTLYGTRDSEMLAGAAHPTFELGLALRFSFGRARPEGSGR